MEKTGMNIKMELESKSELEIFQKMSHYKYHKIKLFIMPDGV